MKIIFMGTPDFASSILTSLASSFDVCAVFTQPDKPQGRKMVLTPPPVKNKALELGIPVYQPETLKNEAILPLLNEYAPDAIVVAAYGKILPSYILDYPHYGCINVHASLLPMYRGAAPIQRSIIDGCNKTGVTTMLMEKGLDTGDMLEKAEVVIEDGDNFETVHDKLAKEGSALIISTLNGIFEAKITPVKQDDSLATYAAKIENADCEINFSKSARCIFNQIRGLSPVPLAQCTHGEKKLKIISARIANGSGTPGEIINISKDSITVACQEGAIEILVVKPEGKKVMSVKDCLNGRMFSLGEILK